jgi:branched-subunit amino acid ABC-type transport system permease component
VVCGVSLGVIETLATAYGITIGPLYFGSNWQNGYAFVLMIAVLAWRPQGLFRGTGEL